MKKITLLFSVLMVLIVSCEKDSENIIDEKQTSEDLICEDCGIEVTKDDERLSEFDQDIMINSINGETSKTSTTSKTNGMRLKLKAIVDPLYVKYKGQDVLLNANHVAVKNRRVAASYSLVGEPYSGAVDVISVPKRGSASLEGTLILPDRDVDAVDFSDDSHLLLGGGFDAQVYYGGDHPSFLGQYQLNYNEDTDVLSLKEEDIFHSIFGNKLRSIKTIEGVITGAGGGNSGVIYAFNEQTNTIIDNNSTETEGLFILDTSVELNDDEYKFVALAFNNDTKELQAFYYDISKETDIMSFSYAVSLGTFNNINVEAKYSVTAITKDWLAVSLGVDGIGVFNIRTDSSDNKTAFLIQQIKEEILDANAPDDVVNSFVFDSGVFYVAAGGAGFYLMEYDYKRNKLKNNFSHVDFGEGDSVNGVAISGEDLVIASTKGVSIYKLSGLKI
ncbi:hypothetical protein [Thalassobellus citreus]|uniref:hypothetical protein n=1 Tax=Thalassobellus citreus TaxID=3367752 RepID=UPI00378BA994